MRINTVDKAGKRFNDKKKEPCGSLLFQFADSFFNPVKTLFNIFHTVGEGNADALVVAEGSTGHR